MSWRGDSNVCTLLHSKVLTTTATQRALCVSTTSEVYKLESRGYAQIEALIIQITNPILV